MRCFMTGIVLFVLIVLVGRLEAQEMTVVANAKIIAYCIAPSEIHLTNSVAIPVGISLTTGEGAQIPKKVTFHTNLGSFNNTQNKSVEVSVEYGMACCKLLINNTDVDNANKVTLWVTSDEAVLCNTTIDLRKPQKISIIGYSPSIFANSKQLGSVRVRITDNDGLPVRGVPAFMYIKPPKEERHTIVGCSDSNGYITFVVPACSYEGIGSFYVESNDLVTEEENIPYHGVDFTELTVSIAAPQEVILTSNTLAPIFVSLDETKMDPIPTEIILKTTGGTFLTSKSGEQLIKLIDGNGSAELILDDIIDSINISVIVYLRRKDNNINTDIPVGSTYIRTRVENRIALTFKPSNYTIDSASGTLFATLFDDYGTIPVSDSTITIYGNIPGLGNVFFKAQTNTQGSALFPLVHSKTSGIATFQARTTRKNSSTLLVKYGDKGEIEGYGYKFIDGDIDYVAKYTYDNNGEVTLIEIPK